MGKYFSLPYWVLIAVVSSFSTLVASTASASNASALQEARETWVQALKSMDLNTAGGFVAADFSAVLDAGQPLNRAAFIAALRSDRYDTRDFAFNTTPAQVRLYDGAAIVAGKGVRTIASEEQTFVREVRRSTGRSYLRETTVESEEERRVQFTEIWAWHQQRWQLIHLQWTDGPSQ
jgi:hypothetical protein